MCLVGGPTIQQATLLILKLNDLIGLEEVHRVSHARCERNVRGDVVTSGADVSATDSVVHCETAAVGKHGDGALSAARFQYLRNEVAAFHTA